MSTKRMQLFLLPFAGGNSASFHCLTELLDECIDVVCVEYAGRLSRRKEAYITEYKDFLKDTADYINAKRNGSPFSILGYSLGSVLAFDLVTKKMIYGEPEHCFICARGDLRNKGISQTYHELTDDEFVQKMICLGGFDQRILDNKRFLDIYMEPVRRDYEVWCKYKYIEHNSKILCNTTVIYCAEDPMCADIYGWKDLIKGNVEFYEFGHDHFFINQYYKEIAEIINAHLEIIGQDVKDGM